MTLKVPNPIRASRVTLDKKTPVTGKKVKPQICPSGKDDRYQAVGPIRSVVDASDCSGWARAVAP